MSPHEQNEAEADVPALRRRLAAAAPGEAPEQMLAVLEAIERHTRIEGGTGRDAAALAADLGAWQRFCHRFALEQEAGRAAGALEALAEGEIERWRAGARAEAGRERPDPEALLAWLGQASDLRFAWPGAAGVSEALEPERSALRAAFERTGPAAAGPRAHEAWAVPWIDRAAVALTEADEVPERAAERLGAVAEELAWLAGCLGRGRAARRLRRKARRLAAEAQERALQRRLERLFGTRAVAFAERLVLGLTFLVLALLAVEATVALSPGMAQAFLIADTAACAFFLFEYFTKVALAEGRLRWALRHAFVDLLPSIPFGLLVGGGDAVRAGRLGRLLRLPRLARYLRLLRPAIRALRGVSLLARGLDRLVRRYGRLLNQNVILYPTEEELARAGTAQTEAAGDPARRLQLEARQRWQMLIACAPPAERARLAGRRLDLLAAAEPHPASAPGPSAASGPAARREIPAGVLLRRLERLRPEAVEATLGPELVARLGRAVRLLANPPLVWLPVIRQCVPPVRADDDDNTVLAGAARRIARWLKRLHDAWFWAADLYGTVTPSQFVDRVGGVLVKGAFRPAYRLAIAAGGLLLVELLLQLTSIPALERARQWLFNFAGIPVMVLGSVCMLLLGIGWWFQRLAQEATDFYERSAKAQFLALTEVIHKRAVERDGRILYERVLRPHHRDLGTREDPAAFLERLRGTVAGSREAADEADERLELLYRDWSDGAPLTDTDTRATGQLLGDPTLQGLFARAGRVSGAEQKQLERLDLERQKSVFGGPYLWFNLITRAVAHSVACLLVEYNRHAIPLDELDQVPEAARQAYRGWLDSEASGAEAQAPAAHAGYMTTAFTALHFLDPDPGRDAAVAARFGPEVRRRLERDRQLMIRRLFGTWPLHEQPRERRTVNLYRFYERWLAGGRALLVPIWLLAAACGILKRGLIWLAGAVREIYEPRRRRGRVQAARADFAVATRKINRMRGPLVELTLRLRANLDPAYLGCAAPGGAAPAVPGAAVEEDLDFYGADTELREAVEQARARTAAEMARLEPLIAGGLLERAAAARGLAAGAFASPRHRQAAAVIYCGDLGGVRSLLSGAEVLEAIAARGGPGPTFGERASLRLPTRYRFGRFTRARGIRAPGARAALWRAVRENTAGAGDALRAWAAWGEEEAPREAERRLADQLIRVARLDEELLTLRAIQTLAILDVIHYREHVHRLGGYGGAIPAGPIRSESRFRAENRGLG